MLMIAQYSSRHFRFFKAGELTTAEREELLRVLKANA
jgi:hypothetical protein